MLRETLAGASHDFTDADEEIIANLSLHQASEAMRSQMTGTPWMNIAALYQNGNDFRPGRFARTLMGHGHLARLQAICRR